MEATETTRVMTTKVNIIAFQQELGSRRLLICCRLNRKQEDPSMIILNK